MAALSDIRAASSRLHAYDDPIDELIRLDSRYGDLSPAEMASGSIVPEDSTDCGSPLLPPQSPKRLSNYMRIFEGTVSTQLVETSTGQSAVSIEVPIHFNVRSIGAWGGKDEITEVAQTRLKLLVYPGTSVSCDSSRVKKESLDTLVSTLESALILFRRVVGEERFLDRTSIKLCQGKLKEEEKDERGVKLKDRFEYTSQEDGNLHVFYSSSAANLIGVIGNVANEFVGSSTYDLKQTSCIIGTSTSWTRPDDVDSTVEKRDRSGSMLDFLSFRI